MKHHPLEPTVISKTQHASSTERIGTMRFLTVTSSQLALPFSTSSDAQQRRKASPVAGLVRLLLNPNGYTRSSREVVTSNTYLLSHFLSFPHLRGRLLYRPTLLIILSYLSFFVKEKGSSCIISIVKKIMCYTPG